ncbi:DUF2529 family protein [Halalkalibacter akibai]|uniref:DUF2529 domain-containing protein n=1 Tax=Halalkalibacter akibai (strain ATCC 43226 / DSM 21942 / CIP 109018 / JCM 9157 / 1139) TaxID=1236973 RepID=W4QQJ3_HALA3|nr:DUF2529 family protein [Halalkalibacter akibai]GAE33609.1 hypothetical protein JCM9157_624 [Halalkalibacter akibai JCM 9157]
MQKIFTTQLIGLMKNSIDELILEDAARLLSQALIGDGNVYIFGKDEMVAIAAEALYGKEHLSNVLPLFEKGNMAELDSADRVFLLSREAHDPEMVSLVERVSEKGVLIVGLTAEKKDSSKKLWTDWVDIHLDLQLSGGLVPTDDGDRIGFPASILALYTYFCLHLLIVEFLSEYK